MQPPPPATETKQRTPTRTRFIVLIAIVVVVVLAWLGLWFTGAAYIRNAYDQIHDEAAAEGDELTCGKLDVAGLPFRFDLFCHDLTLRVDDVTVHLPTLEGTVRVYAPTHALLFAEGPLTINDAFTGTRRTLTWDQLEASARTNWTALANISIVGKNIALKDTLVGETLLAEADGFEAHLLDAPEGRDAENHTAQWSLYSILGGATFPELDIENADFRLEADFPGMPDDLRNFDLATIFANWREPNPRLTLHVFEGKDAEASFSLTGNAGLDDSNMWQGDFDLTSNGLDTRLSAITSAPMINMLLGDPNSDGSLYRAYSLRHGVLFAGNAPLTALPPLF